jgi:hypothetical protein
MKTLFIAVGIFASFHTSVPTSNSNLCTSLFSLGYEGTYKGQYSYRLKATALGEAMLNPKIIQSSYLDNEDSILIDLTIEYERMLRDSVYVILIEKNYHGFWNYLAKNRYYLAKDLLGITVNGRVHFKIKNRKFNNLMFIDSDKCVPILGIEIYTCDEP